MRKEQTAAEWAETLFSLYEQKMFAVAYAIVRDEGRAEEAVMDAFERLVKAGERQTGRWADGSGRLAEAAGWLDPRSDDMKRPVIRTIQSTSIDIYRKTARERGRVVYVDDEVLASIEEPAPAAPEEATQVAEPMLSELSEGYRAVLKKRIIEGCSVAETAAALGISQPNVRKRQERALNVLRRQMGENNGF